MNRSSDDDGNRYAGADTWEQILERKGTPQPEPTIQQKGPPPPDETTQMTGDGPSGRSGPPDPDRTVNDAPDD